MGRWKLGDNGGYYDPNDSGPDQVQPQVPMQSPDMSPGWAGQVAESGWQRPAGMDDNEWARLSSEASGFGYGGRKPGQSYDDWASGLRPAPAPGNAMQDPAVAQPMQSPYIGLVNGPRVGDTLTPPEMSLEQAQSMQPSVLSALQGAGMGRLSGLISGALGGSRPIGAAMGASPFSATGKALGSALGSPLRSLSGFLRF